MNKILLIGLGSGLGGILRYSLSSFVHTFFNRSFPYGTLVVNSIGCFLMGFLFILIFERFDNHEHFHAFFLIGLLGGFTTFSAFSIETLHLFENNQMLHASLNVFGSVILCLGLTWFGMLLAKQCIA
jgi:CrcB protein